MRVQDKAARVLLKSRMNVAGSQAVALDMKAVAEMKAVWKLENCFTGAGAAENADAKRHQELICSVYRAHSRI